jgi:integrase
VAFGAIPLRSAKHSHVLTGLASKPLLSGKTVNNYVSVLREAFELATLDGTIPANPCAKVKRAKWQRDPPDPFSLMEAEAIIGDMRKHYPETVTNFVEFRFFSGLRTSEAFGLRWSSIDFRQRHATISEAIVLGQEKSNTKTNVARLLDLNSRALAALNRQKAITLLAGRHVFNDPRDDKWTHESRFRRIYWEPTLRRLGIRFRGQNHARHTYATMLLMAGATPAHAAKQMGHSVEMFLTTYSKWVDGGRNDAEQARLEAFIAESPRRVPEKARHAGKWLLSKRIRGAGEGNRTLV